MRILSRRPAATRRVGLVLIAACVMSACSPSGREEQLPPLSKAPVWERVPAADLPSDFVDFEPSSMSSSTRGFFAASSYSPSASSDVTQKVFASLDGRNWRDRTPSNMSTAAMRQSLASHGSTTWLLGGQGFEIPRVAVWKTTDNGSSWKPAALMPVSPDVEIPVAIAVGASGVVVVTKVTPGMGKPEEEMARLRVRSADTSGKFTRSWETPCPGHEGSEAGAEALVTDDGFYLLTDCTTTDFEPADKLFKSADGRKWTPDSLPSNGNEFDHMARNGSVTVLTGGLASDNVEHTTQPRIWYRKDNGRWRTTGPLDPGRLPDAGVVARHGQKVVALTAAGTGFVAVGFARAPDDSSVGAMWFSPDGKKWAKQRTRANGFTSPRSLTTLTARGNTIAVLASHRYWETGDPAHARIWIGDLAPRTRRSQAPSPAPLAPFVGTWIWSGASITIARNGDFTYRYTTLVQCSDHAPPCDEGEKMGGRATGTLRPGHTSKTAVGTFNEPVSDEPAGSTIKITRKSYKTIEIAVNGNSYGLFCEPHSSRCAGHVGAG
ncbi:hypothetical protein [Streptomyces hawaiiensis]|uniref:hypothetical protein n=1 Tax=Streptomyces hawaiiensis TaxID=67305 RepID=UPI001586CB82|nr:hypothetical protein [Streptomyces hawaiiensis]